jgi:hypothetical protein
MTVCYDLKSDKGRAMLDEDAKARGVIGKSSRVCFVNEQSEPEEDEKPKRTPTQNNAMHLYFTNLAEALNAAGYDMKKTMKADADIPWTDHAIKVNLWKVIEHAMFGHDSTTKLDTSQCSQVYEVVNRKIATTTGVSVPWPSKQELIHAARVADMMRAQR